MYVSRTTRSNDSAGPIAARENVSYAMKLREKAASPSREARASEQGFPARPCFARRARGAGIPLNFMAFENVSTSCLRAVLAYLMPLSFGLGRGYHFFGGPSMSASASRRRAS